MAIFSFMTFTPASGKPHVFRDGSAIRSLDKNRATGVPAIEH
jgi:hypothetical protein